MSSLLQDAVTQMQGGSSRVSNLLIACMRKTEDWLAAQRSNFEDHRPWLAYKRVLIKLESDRHCSHLTTAVKEWMDECVTHEHHVDEVCVHYKPLIGSVRGAWNQEHLLDYRHLRTLTQPLMDECLTQHWDAAVPWSAGLLEESSSNHPSRRSSQTGNASGTHVPQAAPHLPNPALANTAQHSHREQLWDNSHVEHPQYNAEEAQQSQPAVEPGFTQTADTDTSYPNMLMPDSVRSPWTQHDKSCIDSALQAPGAAEQLEQQLQQVWHWQKLEVKLSTSINSCIH